MALNNSINSPVLGGISTLTTKGVLLGNGTGAITASTAPTQGQLIGGGATATKPITLTSSNSSITIDTSADGIVDLVAVSSGSGINYSTVSGASELMVANSGYISTGSALTTYTLPVSAALGETFVVTCDDTNTSFSKVVPNTGQKIRVGTAVSGIGALGSVTCTAIGDTLTLVCIDDTTAAQRFVSVNSVGNFTVV